MSCSSLSDGKPGRPCSRPRSASDAAVGLQFVMGKELRDKECKLQTGGVGLEIGEDPEAGGSTRDDMLSSEKRQQ